MGPGGCPAAERYQHQVIAEEAMPRKTAEVGGKPGSGPDCVMIITHGVGNQERWLDLEEFQSGLMTFLNQRLRGQTRLTTRPAPASASLERGFDIEMEPDSELSPKVRLRLREFHWADLDGGARPSPAEFGRQFKWLWNKVRKAKWSRLCPAGVARGARLGLWCRVGGLFLALALACVAGIILSGWHWAKSGLGLNGYSLSAQWAGALMEYVRDISNLDERENRAAINGRFNRLLTDVIAHDRPGSLVIVSHSLGCIFALDQFKRQLKRYGLPLGWVCMGSPLWALGLIDDDFDYQQDLDRDLALGWYNIYDLFDPVGGPIFHPNLANPAEQWRRHYWNPIKAHRSYLTTKRHVARLWELTAGWLADPPKSSNLSAARSPRYRRPLRLGPQLRHADGQSLTVWTAMVEPGRYRAELAGPDSEIRTLEADLDRESDLTRAWRFEDLAPGCEYRFRVSRLEEAGGRITAWPLTRRNRSGELMTQRPTWWTFATLNPDRLPVRLMFASCNQPFHVHWDGESGYYFVNRLLEDMERLPEHKPDAAFYIGDQIYADDWWQDELYLPWRNTDARQTARLRSYGQVYDRFWQSHSWTDLLGKAPSYMIWDDHEIRDGWGCNVHDFIPGGKDFTPAAWQKFQAATKAMDLYQVKGNPPGPAADDFQFQVDLGPISTFVFDNRMKRNYRRADEFHPYGVEQMERFKTWVREAGQQKDVLIVVCSTPPVFFPPWRLNFVADKCPPVLRWLEKFINFEAVDDDLRDQLPYRLNMLTRDTILAELAAFLEQHPVGAKRAVIIGGDVHVGGYVRIEVDGRRVIDQWIASPITNKPNHLMYKAARYARCSQMVGQKAGRKMKAHRFLFKPHRNVVLLHMEEPPAPGQAPLVRGEFVYEKGFNVKRVERVMD